MTLFRIEFDVESEVRTEIAQTPYKNGLGQVLVLDAEFSPPEGYVEFDPSVVEEPTT